MVNRAGRSKGCTTCRRRKVKCDEGRPECTRCVKSGNECEGYPESKSFVWVGPGRSSSTSERSTTPIGPVRRGSHIPIDPALEESTLPLSRRRSTNSLGISRISFSNVYSNLFILPELDSSSFQENIYQSHLAWQLLGHTETGRKGVLSSQDTNSTDLNRDCINALAMTFFGRMNHQPDISHQGDVLYSKAILQLAGKLSASTEAFSMEVLMATLTLTIHELVNSTQYNGWIQHAGGVGRLVEARGPWRHQSPQELILFESSRPMIIAKALSDNKRSFLEEPDWQNIPWALDPASKTYQSGIFDILTIVPGLFEDLVNFTVASSTPETAFSSLSINAPIPSQLHQALHTRITTTLSSLDHWYQSWSATFPTAVQSILPTHHPDLTPAYPPHLFGLPLAFPSLLLAHEYTLYNSTLFLLLSLLHRLTNPPSLPSFPIPIKPLTEHDGNLLNPTILAILTAPPPIAASTLSTKLTAAATEICRAVPYHLQFEKHAYSGAYALCFPLNIVLGIRGVESEEGTWVMGVLGEIAGRWGIAAGGAQLARVREMGAGKAEKSVREFV